MKFPPIIYKEGETLGRVLRRRGIDATVDGVNVDGDTVRYMLRLGEGHSIREVRRLAKTLAHAVGRPSCTVEPFEDLVILEMAPRPRPLFLADVWEAVQQLPAGTALLGTTHEEQPVRLRLDSPDVTPLLVSGGRQVGKSALLRMVGLTLAVASSPREWRMALVPGLHQDSLALLTRFPHVWNPTQRTAGTPQHLISIVETLIDAPRSAFEAQLLVLVDDVDDVLVATGRAGISALSWLITEGPERGILPVVVSRRVHKLDQSLLTNFVLHAAGRPAANTPVPPVLQGIDPDIFPRLPGEFFLSGATVAMPLRVAWTGEASTEEVIRWYRHRQPIVFVQKAEPAHEVQDEAGVDNEGESETEPADADWDDTDLDFDLDIPELEFDDTNSS